MTENLHPKLELLANIAVEATVMFDKPKTGSKPRKDGTTFNWYLYGLEVQRVQHNFFCPEALHYQIEKAGVKKGDRIAIAKTEAIEDGNKVVRYKLLSVNGREYIPPEYVEHPDGKLQMVKKPSFAAPQISIPVIPMKSAAEQQLNATEQAIVDHFKANKDSILSGCAPMKIMAVDYFIQCLKENKAFETMERAESIFNKYLGW